MQLAHGHTVAQGEHGSEVEGDICLGTQEDHATDGSWSWPVPTCRRASTSRQGSAVSRFHPALRQ